MKQVTGSKTSDSVNNKVSIQLSLDGHSFSLPEPKAEFPAGTPVEVELLTPKTMLVPAELSDREDDRVLLASNAVSVADDECVVSSAPGSSAVALMAVPSALTRDLAEHYGDRLHYTTPLLHEVKTEQPTVWMDRRGGLLYIKVYDPALQLAEVIPAADDADILYFIERLGTAFPLAEYVLCVAGDDAARLRRLLGKIFKESVCE